MVNKSISVLCIGFLISLPGCSSRPGGSVSVNIPAAASPLPAVPDPSTYIDLQAMWRVRAVIPILKSGGHVLNATQRQTEGNTVTLSTGGDFLGYEIVYYDVEEREGGGVRIAFRSAEIVQGEVTEAQPQSIAPLFRLPFAARLVRLIYLIRVSQSDHDMAVVAAGDIDALNALTLRVQSDPAGACHDEPATFCSWVPQGIAVRAEGDPSGQ